MKICPKCGKEYQDANTLCPADGTVLKKAGDDLIGQTLAGKYRVEETISEGGMGTVYRGTHILIDKTVAIKVLHPALAADDKIVARFSREAKAASRISHPHALNVTDFGESDNGVVFLVMEHLRGKTLKEVVQSGGAMPLPRIVEIMRQVGGALDAAHAEGVVHRDLKSDNIMLVDGSGSGGDWAKVLDFGIAKIQEPVGQDPALTAPNLIIGTPQYMSPEQCSQASEIDARSDVYSLGVILFEMLVGHVPFAGESPTAIMMKHLQEPPPSVLDERKDLPAAVGRVVARAMAKRPEDRYQSAGELVEALSLAVNEAPAAALTDAGPAATDRSTKRIVVPTDPNMPSRGTTNEGYDETTVIRPRPDQAAAVAAQAAYAQTGPPPESFNPWRIIIPAAAGLLVIFAVIYAVTRNAKPPATNEQATPLTADPNSKPVRPAPPATGQGEQGITSKVPGASPSPTLNSNTVSNTNAASNVNQNRNANASSRRGNSNANDTGDTAQNDNTANENEAQPSPTATPSGKNSNRQRELPSPQTNPSTSVPPPTPSATPKKPPALPRATPPPETPPQATQPEAGP